MKGNAKKGALFISVVTIMMFIAAPMALAGQGGFHSFGINGVYAVTGFSSCGPGSGIMEATYNFKPNGIGSVSGITRNSPTAAPLPVMAFMAEFHYTVTQEGRIKFQYPNPPDGPGGLIIGAINEEEDFDTFSPFLTLNAGPSHGVISQDGKMITISCGPPIVLWPINPAGEKDGDEMTCVTSLAGMRIH